MLPSLSGIAGVTGQGAARVASRDAPHRQRTTKAWTVGNHFRVPRQVGLNIERVE